MNNYCRNVVLRDVFDSRTKRPEAMGHWIRRLVVGDGSLHQYYLCCRIGRVGIILVGLHSSSKRTSCSTWEDFSHDSEPAS